MKPNDRQLKKWRKDSPSNHRSYAEKRNRGFRHVDQEMKNAIREDNKYKGENN